LFEQLRYEGFTKEEAKHGVEQSYGAPAKPAIRNADRPVDARQMNVVPAVAEGNVIAEATVAKPAEDLESFVKAYIQSGASDTSSPVLEIAFYADHVDYFAHGLVDRDFIAKDVRDYAKRWPQRWLAINGPIEFAVVNARTVRATFQTSFGAANAKKAVRGVVESVLLIDIAGNQPVIISAKSFNKIDA
jgi:hypothetical protein